MFAFYANNISAQDVRFTASIYSEPQHFSTELWEEADGFNIGLGIEYQMTITYFDIDMYMFPNLNGADYFEIQGTLLGFNHHSRFRDWRFKLGLIKPGFNKRDNQTYPMIGSDVGIEYYFNTFYVGAEVSGNYREDNKYWGVDEGFYRVNAGIKIGIQW